MHLAIGNGREWDKEGEEEEEGEEEDGGGDSPFWSRRKTRGSLVIGEAWLKADEELPLTAWKVSRPGMTPIDDVYTKRQRYT